MDPEARMNPIEKRFQNLDEPDEGAFQQKTEKRLDVRPILDRGIDPFEEIMDNLRKLQKDEYLKIINYFEPIPLYGRLKEMGYSFKTKQHGMYYHIRIFSDNLFTTENDPKPREEMPGFDAGGFLQVDEKRLEVLEEKLRGQGQGKVAFLDVSNLGAPEPVTKILEALMAYPAPTLLVVRHRMRPMHLPGFLREKGYLVASYEKEDFVRIYVVCKDILSQI